MTLIWYDDIAKHDRQVVGGKGLGLFELLNARKELEESQKRSLFKVPDFAIIPDGDNSHTNLPELTNRLKFPLIARSSSPNEDGGVGTFAGLFDSVQDINSLDDLRYAISQVRVSAHSSAARDYAAKLKISLTSAMPVIIQEFKRFQPNVLQLGELGGRAETENSEGDISKHEINYSFLDKYAPFKIYSKLGGHIAEFDDYFLWQTARELRSKLRMTGTAQFEGGIIPGDSLYFVQARQLPEIKLPAHVLSSVRTDVPYLEAKVCNDVSGSLTLPAYVTVSHSYFPQLLAMNGISSALSMGKRDDAERIDRFYQRSKLGSNSDAIMALHTCRTFDRIHDDRAYHRFEAMWRRGNKLFSDYILVCDKLDESQIGMAQLTTNKRAIITCAEAVMNSHAMTVARDLGIMALGCNRGNNHLDSFYHQVETGDLIHVESDGMRAFAYLEKRREKDPYAISVSD